MGNNKRGHISVSKATYEQLRDWCRKNGSSVSSVVERLIETKLEHERLHKANLAQVAGLGHVLGHCLTEKEKLNKEDSDVG